MDIIICFSCFFVCFLIYSMCHNTTSWFHAFQVEYLLYIYVCDRETIIYAKSQGSSYFNVLLSWQLHKNYVHKPGLSLLLVILDSQQRKGCLYSVLFCNIWRCKIFIVHTVWKFVKHDKLKLHPKNL